MATEFSINVVYGYFSTICNFWNKFFYFLFLFWWALSQQLKYINLIQNININKILKYQSEILQI